MARKSLSSGAALEKMKVFIEGQGGDSKIISDCSLFPQHTFAASIVSPKTGFVEKLYAKQVGIASQHTGAGRAAKEDMIDMAAGIYLGKKTGDAVLEGEILATVYGNDEDKVQIGAKELKSAYVIGAEPVKKMSLVKKVIGL